MVASKEKFEITKTEEEWRKILTTEQYFVKVYIQPKRTNHQGLVRFG